MCTPLPASALRYAGSVATSVLPSPVFISAILPRCSTIPPISCTSKCRMLSVRRPASRTTEKASGSRSSSVCPCWKRDRNSSVLARSCSSESDWTDGSSALISVTTGARRFSSRSLAVPKTFARALSMIIADGYPPIVPELPAKAGSHLTGGEQGHRVGQAAVHPDFVVQVRTSRPAGRSDVTDDVAARDLLARPHVEPRQVAVLGDDAEAVVEHHHVAVRAVRARAADRRVSGRQHRLAVIGGNVESGVEIGPPGNRIAPCAIRRGEPAGNGPDRRRGRRERMPALDAVADG